MICGPRSLSMVQTYKTLTNVSLISPSPNTDSIEQYVHYDILVLHSEAFLVQFNFFRVLRAFEENGEENSYPGDSLSPTRSLKPNAAILKTPSFKGY